MGQNPKVSMPIPPPPPPKKNKMGGEFTYPNMVPLVLTATATSESESSGAFEANHHQQPQELKSATGQQATTRPQSATLSQKVVRRVSLTCGIVLILNPGTQVLRHLIECAGPSEKKVRLTSGKRVPIKSWWKSNRTNVMSFMSAIHF